MLTKPIKVTWEETKQKVYSSDGHTYEWRTIEPTTKTGTVVSFGDTTKEAYAIVLTSENKFLSVPIHKLTALAQ